MLIKKVLVSLVLFNFNSILFLQASEPQASPRIEYRLLATLRTSTMEKEMNQASEAGFRFAGIMAGETALGGSETVVVMSRSAGASDKGRWFYKLLATSRTSAMQKELREFGELGFEYKGQTIFKEVIVILERDREALAHRYQYQLAATNKTSTMQKELSSAGQAGFSLVGITVAETSFGGKEVVAILSKMEIQQAEHPTKP